MKKLVQLSATPRPALVRWRRLCGGVIRVYHTSFSSAFALVVAGAVFQIGYPLNGRLQAATPSETAKLTAAQARGKLIYTKSRNAAGGELYFRLIGGGQRLPAGGVTCASCHGADGRGDRSKEATVPVITYGVLIKPRYVSSAKQTRPPYSDALLARAISQGLDSAGQPLNPTMPRWSLSDGELRDLIDYLKLLGNY